MKLYTDESQPAKMIGLWFEKPTMKNIPTPEGEVNEEWYSIGELIEMLPKYTDDSGILHIEAYDSIGWDVWYWCYCNGDEVSVEYSTENKELVDALYDMIVKLKAEEKI